MAAPRPDGSEAARAMTMAMAEGRVSPAEVGYISAHAAGTVVGDVAEARAIRAALGRYWTGVPVSGTKPLHGHALGATGAIEIAITALAMRHDWLPPTSNLTTPGQDCELDHIPPGGLSAGADVALCNSFGFGGINACVLLRRPADD
jgi:3-oxoacyl-[acyl-carrier-protein] synthase II